MGPPAERWRLREADFNRLGLPMHEFRAPVIRRAAARSAELITERNTRPDRPRRGQAGIQVDAANQLAELSLATYRLLDPRNRANAIARVNVARILPQALSASSPIRFAGGADQWSGSSSSARADLFRNVHDRAIFGPQAETWQNVGVDASEGVLTRVDLPRVDLPRVDLSDVGVPRVVETLDDVDLLRQSSLQRRLRPIASVRSVAKWFARCIAVTTLLALTVA